MLRKRKEPKPKKSMVKALMRDMQGSAAEKLAMFEKLKAGRGFANASAVELRKVENMLRAWTRGVRGVIEVGRRVCIGGHS